MDEVEKIQYWNNAILPELNLLLQKNVIVLEDFDASQLPDEDQIRSIITEITRQSQGEDFGVAANYRLNSGANKVKALLENLKSIIFPETRDEEASRLPTE